MKPTLHLQENGTYKINHVDLLSYTYFPLTNNHAVKSVITPKLNGSMTIDQNSFLLVPTSNEDSHNSFMNRNVYFKVNNEFVWSITGNTPYQMLYKDNVTLDVDFLVHTITREHPLFQTTVVSFAPMIEQFQELHKVTIKNTSNNPLTLKPVVSIPLYSRSADSIRDHRHVTSLLNKAIIKENGITNKPTFSFDERGHLLNMLSYSVYSYADNAIKNYWPILEDFIGEGGNLLLPSVVLEDKVSTYKKGDEVSGYELTGGFEYEEITLKPSEEHTLYISLKIDEEGSEEIINDDRFEELLSQTKKAWQKELNTLQITYKDPSYNGWLKWVSIQPIFRRIYGNSFLPHHDYGRGGRGWRDLWQDLLALILMNPSSVRENLLNNFQGVRIDGSNATIIGEKPGEFLADRNNIARVWMDHGSWPLLTTKLYLDKVRDTVFLLEEITYFNDKFSHYTKKVNETFTGQTILQDKQGKIYKGTVLEHLIIQNLVPYYNVGQHNNIRLEDADWNDGLDMAHGKGESVAFTSMYADNLVLLGSLLRSLEQQGIQEIELLEEMVTLLQDNNHNDVDEKRSILQTYFDKVEGTISGNKVKYKPSLLAEILEEKGNLTKEHVRNNEWVQGDTYSWFNGYYDNDSLPLDSVAKEDMTLTGQVFAIMCNVATPDQIKEIIKSADHYLYDKAVAGYKLNTDYKQVKTNMGRLFGFAYGHKENGAMFSHMAVMFANGLYKRGFAEAGNKVLSTIYNHCIDIEQSKMYPGIPEYVDPKGRGMYPYLTGSASWYILTEVTEVFGIKGNFGNIVLEPKLLKHQFNNNQASIKTIIHEKLVEIIYINEDELTFGDYKILQVLDNKQPIPFKETEFGVELLSQIQSNKLEVVLSGK